MKTRFLIYGSLLFVTLTLSVIYKVMETNIQKQEALVRKQKENWLYTTAMIELILAKNASNAKAFWYHYYNACDFILAWCEMLQQDFKS